MKLLALAGVILVALVSSATSFPVSEDQDLTHRDTPVTAIPNIFADTAAGCSPNLKKCDTDGVTLLQCNNAGAWEVFKKCPTCCRYGNHGYADCYTECSTNVFPRNEADVNTSEPEFCRPHENGGRLCVGPCGQQRLKQCNGSQWIDIMNCGDSCCGWRKRPQLSCLSKKECLHNKWTLCPLSSADNSETPLERRDSLSDPCTLGQRKCQDNTLYYCTPNDHWVSLKCQRCGRGSDGRPACVGPPPELNLVPEAMTPDEGSDATLVERGDVTPLTDDSLSGIIDEHYLLIRDKEPPTDCEPGTTKCSANRKNLEKCTSDSTWVKSRTCPMHCFEPHRGSAFCDKGSGEEDSLLVRGWNCKNGATRCSEDKMAVQKCNSKGWWDNSRDCPSGCIEIRGIAFCQKLHDAERENQLEGQLKDEPITVDLRTRYGSEPNSTDEVPVPQEYCSNPGQYACGQYQGKSAVVVCSPSHVWILSSICGPVPCCQLGPTWGTAYCTCSASANSREQPRSIGVEPAKLEVSLSSRDLIKDSCNPGTTSCHFWRAPGGLKEGIAICNAAGKWVTQSGASCGNIGCCTVHGSPPQAFCVCSPSAELDSQSTDVEVMPTQPTNIEIESSKRDTFLAPRFSFSCEPSATTCIQLGRRSSIHTCDHVGNWKFVTWCDGGRNCCNMINDQAYCTCAPSANSLDSVKARNDIPFHGCVPGSTVCYRSLVTNRSAVRTCDENGQWSWITNCPGGAHCCNTVNGQAACTCSPSAKSPDSIDARSDIVPRGCNPGTTRCASDYDGAHRSLIQTCAADGNWKTITLCGGQNCCSMINGQAYCTCSASANSPNEEVEGLNSVPSIRAAQSTFTTTTVQSQYVSQ